MMLSTSARVAVLVSPGVVMANVTDMPVDMKALCPVFMLAFVTYLIPPRRACDTTSGVVLARDRYRPTASQIPLDSTTSCLELHLPRASERAPSQFTSRKPIAPFRPTLCSYMVGLGLNRYAVFGSAV